ncbi:MAG: 16S rRNA (guanine(966)-N(2))-methyltransferase RsmD [Acidobacteriia bacterium]|nr:16S rRNA (guanine(966)-N(2))-methyltransferase RsmD [Terriglobia bacterium]
MRVIAGKYKSRRLAAPQGIETRPTSDRLRETLFNVVTPGIKDSVWLDLFAGSGAVGIEALSRGARSVYFVESAGSAARTIRKNLHTLKIEEGAEVIERDAVVALRMLDFQAVTCDFVFLDPPYRKLGDYERVLSFLSQSRLLNPGSRVIAEHDKHFDPGDTFGSLRRFRKLRQGDAVLSFYSVAPLQTAQK